MRVLIAIFMFLSTMVAQAAGTCLADKTDIAADMQKITQKLNLKYGNLKLQQVNGLKTDLNEDLPDDFYNDEQLKVDRSYKMLTTLNAVGVITDAPMDSFEGYGSAVLISPCHVLVNAHAVTRKDAKLGKENVYISLGQNNCNSKNEFLHQDMPGKVIAIGDSNEDSTKVRASKDWAIIRINQVSDIKAAEVSTDFINMKDSLATVGFPFSTTYIQKSGLRYPTLNFTRKTSAEPDGTVKILNKADLPGASGAGIFLLDKDEKDNPQLVLSGIFVGARIDSSGGIGLQTVAIILHMQAINPKAYNELFSAANNNTCH